MFSYQQANAREAVEVASQNAVKVSSAQASTSTHSARTQWKMRSVRLQRRFKTSEEESHKHSTGTSVYEAGALYDSHAGLEFALVCLSV